MSEAHDEVIASEARLRRAMLAGDVSDLGLLLSDHLVFIDQNGNRLGKDDDLAAHRSGLLSLDQIEVEGKPRVTVLGDVALASVAVVLSGTYAGERFAGAFVYSRVWRRHDQDWQVVAAHCSAVRSNWGQDLTG